MSTITTKDGTEIYYKDWGPRSAQPIVFHHGWPLSGDDWDTQMLYFLGKGYRVIAHDRRGHGRSSQVSDGHDMDHHAADVAAVVEHLDLRNAVHIGHSTGGGEATRYVARHGQCQGRVAKLVLIGAVPPLMLKTPTSPAACRRKCSTACAPPSLATARSSISISRAVLSTASTVRARSQYRPSFRTGGGRPWRAAQRRTTTGIKAFSETDFTEDLKSISVPTLVMHGDDDQIVPIANHAPLTAKLLKQGTLKVYKNFPHGMCTTHAETVNPDLLAFVAGAPSRS